ncbi:MAG: FtsX-like permease family protein [Promethearchaeota archaeon]
MSAARKTRKLQKSGNKAYGLSYALSSIRANPFRAVSLALTLSLGISLFASTMVWGDTGVYVSIYQYLGDNSFQLHITPLGGDYTSLGLAENYLKADSLVEKTVRMNSSLGLVWGNNLTDNTMYDINGPVYSDGIKDCQVVFIDNDFLELAANEFWVQGSFELKPGEIVVSSLFAWYYNVIYDTELQIGDIIDIEILTGAVPTLPAQIGNLGRYSLTNLTIVGIFNAKSSDSLIAKALPTMQRASFSNTNIRYPALGLQDSVFILNDAIPPDTIDEDSFFAPSTLVRVSAGALASSGPENLASNLFDLADRTKTRFNIDWEGSDKILDMQRSIDTYISTLSLSILALPIILLALFFSVFAADAFMAPRTVEVGIIRSKGASYSQVSSIFLWETAIIATLAVVFGVVFSILFAPLIPASTSFMSFDWSIYTFYLSRTVVSASTVLRSIGLTVLPSILFILYLARKASQAEIGLTLTEYTEDPTEHVESHGFTIGMSVGLLALVIIMMYILPKDSTLFLLELSLGTSAWFFIAYNGSRISRVGLARVSEKMSFVLGQKNLISAGYLKMRKGRIIPLMVVLALTMSSTIAFAIQSESLRVDLGREVSYALGADIRVEGTGYDPLLNETIASVQGVDRVTPVLRTWGRLASDEIQVAGIYPNDYASIGHFDQSSFPESTPSEILSALSATPNGIIISKYQATRLNLSIGSKLTLEMADIGVSGNQLVDFSIVGIVHSAPGFGYASITDIPYSELGSGFGFQTGYSGFALANLEFVGTTIGSNITDMFLGNLSQDANTTRILEEIQTLPGATAFIPQDFDLHAHSLRTALFLNTVEGLFSIGFVMSLTLSVFALSVSLGSVVRERRKEYAIMRAIGGSKRQVVSMVFSEFSGVVIASLALSIILGAVFGYVMGLLLNNMSPFSRTLAATLSFPFGFLSLVLFIEILTMVIGAYLPAREAANTDPAVVLRNM